MNHHSLSFQEIIASIIGSGSKKTSAIDLAHNIIKHGNGVGFLGDCSVEELCEVHGIGISKACQIVAAVELGKRIYEMPKLNLQKISSPKDAADIYMHELRYLKKEKFNVIFLDTKNHIISKENISIGSLNASIVHPREIFNRAVKRSSNAIILIHNHPSGNPEPSKEDVNITKRVVEAGKILGIDVLDHIIVGDLSYYSFKENSLI